MNELIISAYGVPGSVTFDNYEEVKGALQTIIESHFEGVDYDEEGLDAATEDAAYLKQLDKAIKDKKKELKEAYSAPYVEVEEKLDELISIIKPYLNNAKGYMDTAEKREKRDAVMSYAKSVAEGYGDAGRKILESPAFFKDKWLLKGTTAKKYQDEINEIFEQGAADINSIQAVGGENTAALMATYYENLSMDKVKSFLSTLSEQTEETDPLSVESEDNVLGYKVLKITATEDQMAVLMDQIDLMGLEVEEIEDGMPKPMEELTEPVFNSFVCFDIETSGSNGAASGDVEAKITEIGAVRVVNGEIVEKFDMLANPGRKIVPRIARLTHITDDMVKDAPPVDEVIRKFHEFVGDSILVGHNIKSSDLRYINKAAKAAGVHFDGPFLDTYILAKRFKKEQGWEKLNLSYLSGLYGFEHKEVHRAWSDADVNALIYFELKKLCE